MVTIRNFRAYITDKKGMRVATVSTYLFGIIKLKHAVIVYKVRSSAYWRYTEGDDMVGYSLDSVLDKLEDAYRIKHNIAQ